MVNENGTILVVDDDSILCKSLKSILSSEGYEVHTFDNGHEALAFLDHHPTNVAVIDLKMPGMDGLELLTKIKKSSAETEVIIQTGHGSIERAVDAVKRGAYDFLTKPTPKSDLLHIIDRAMEKNSLAHENRLLKSRLDQYEMFDQVIGSSPKFHQVLTLVEQVAPTNATVLITGENGTGKEVIAKMLHSLSPRKDKPFIKVNCSALTETLLESELFGHEQGAFTGAISQRLGRFEVANEGTLFLDEIGEISSSVQVKLLRFLQDRQFERVGSSETISSDVRIIAATNRNLEKAIDESRFREDFFYRLRVIEVNLPSLRDRREDIPLFVDHFIRQFAAKNNKDIHGIRENALKILLNYNWPGNVRELENSIEHAVVLTQSGHMIQGSALPPSLFADNKSRGHSHLTEDQDNHMMIPFDLPMSNVEHLVYEKTLKHFAGDKLKAAQSLGVSERTLYRKIGHTTKDNLQQPSTS